MSNALAHNFDIDSMIEMAAVYAQIASGHKPEVVAARSPLGARAVTVLASSMNLRGGKAPDWTEGEDRFLRASLGVLSEEEIAAQLGRSVTAVHLHWFRDLRLPGPSKAANQLTASQVAELLHVDAKSIHMLIRRGLLPARELPMERRIYSIDVAVFMRWLIDPMNWVYFHPERISDPYLSRLLELKAKRWGDEWWTVGQVARYHGVDHRAVNKYIHEGRLPAADWGNWKVLRSEATHPDLYFVHGKGNKQRRQLQWSADTNAYIVLSRAVGLTHSLIAPNLGMEGGAGMKTLNAHTMAMQRKGQMRSVIRQSGLQVDYDKRTGQLWADWHLHRGRFPSLARAMQRFGAGLQLDKRQISIVRGVLRSWIARFVHGRERIDLLNRTIQGRGKGQRQLSMAYVELCAIGIDPVSERYILNPIAPDARSLIVPDKSESP